MLSQFLAIGIFFLLIAEADRVLCHLVMFQLSFSKILLLFLAGLFIGFWLRNALLVKVIGNPISDGIVFVLHLA